MSDEQLPPSIVGAAGLTGRPQLPPRPSEMDEPDGFDESGDPVWDKPRAVGRAMPSNCLRVMSSPLPPDRGGGCAISCPGRQRDGGCLVDVVRAADAQGVAEWGFELVHEGETVWWDYVGPELVPLEVPVVAEEIPWFKCPHCETVNEQDPANFHYWCKRCGLNAND